MEKQKMELMERMSRTIVGDMNDFKIDKQYLDKAAPKQEEPAAEPKAKKKKNKKAKKKKQAEQEPVVINNSAVEK